MVAIVIVIDVIVVIVVVVVIAVVIIIIIIIDFSVLICRSSHLFFPLVWCAVEPQGGPSTGCVSPNPGEFIWYVFLSAADL